MTTSFELNAKSRTEHGKAYSRRLRRFEGALPAVIYGAEIAPASITIDQNELKILLNNEAAYSHVLTLNVDDKPEQVIIKELQRHPWKQEVLHVDFQRVKAGESISMSVPLHFINEDTCAGIKAGGILSRLMNDVEITCLPSKLPEAIELDIANVALGQTLHLSDIQLPEGVAFAHAVDANHDEAVVSVNAPKGTKAEDMASDEEAAADAE